MELYGPKKRGPKPKTFLLKVRRPEPACQGSRPEQGSLSGPLGGCSPQRWPLVSCNYTAGWQDNKVTG